MPKPDYTTLAFPPAPADRPYVITNMVMSLDGKIVLEGTEQGIGSKVDQRLMRELRVHADMILNGATTLRASGASPRLGDPALEALREARGKPRYATSAVISRSGALPLERIFFTADDFDAVVYLAHDAPHGTVDRVAATGRAVVVLPPEEPLRWMLAHMRHEFGCELLLVEGGAETNAGLLAIGAVDECFTTIGPVIVGGREGKTAVTGEPYTRETAPRLAVLGAVPNEETGEVYLRHRVLRQR